MGIKGLLPQVGSVTRTVSSRDLRSVAVDGYAWLHRGVHACATELGTGQHSTKHVQFCVDRVAALVADGVAVMLVFDGGPLPSKAGTEEERAHNRAEHRRQAVRHLREGHPEQARQAFAKAVDVTPLMAAQVIAALRARWGNGHPQVKWLVAPFEADAQLAYLAREGLVDAVLSEDSDNLAFRVPKTVFKWDAWTKHGQQVLFADVLAMGPHDKLDLRGFDADMFLSMCILAGCDYVPPVPGIGIKTAHQLVARHKRPPNLLRALRFSCGGAVPADYEQHFKQAVLTFHHQRVFDPRTRTVVHLTPPGPGVKVPDFVGPDLPRAQATAIADGLLDPVTRQPFPPESLSFRNAASSAAPMARTPASKAATAPNSTLHQFFAHAPPAWIRHTPRAEAPEIVSSTRQRFGPARPPPEPRSECASSDNDGESSSVNAGCTSRHFGPPALGKVSPSCDNTRRNRRRRNPRFRPPDPVDTSAGKENLIARKRRGPTQASAMANKRHSMVAPPASVPPQAPVAIEECGRASPLPPAPLAPAPPFGYTDSLSPPVSADSPSTHARNAHNADVIGAFAFGSAAARRLDMTPPCATSPAASPTRDLLKTFGFKRLA